MSQQPATTNSQTPQPETENKPKILVIDDSRLVRVSLNKMLSHEFHLIEAVDGEDGWTMIQQHQDIHVVMTDAGMPRLDGFGLIERVRASDDLRIANLPLIMITGAEEEQTSVRERAFNLGASDFIIKPFDKTQLIARVKSYIRQDHLQRNLEMTASTLKEHSTIDPLTKLHNYDYFIERLKSEMSLAKRHSHELSLIGLRIDLFPRIGQKFGDTIAQDVLVFLVENIMPLIRTEDCLTRTGENEFCLITPATDRMSAAYVGERLRAKVEATQFQKAVISLPFTISLGLVNISRDKLESAESALQEIRGRIEHAQRLGGNRLTAQPVSPTKALSGEQSASPAAAAKNDQAVVAKQEATPAIEQSKETPPVAELAIAAEPIEELIQAPVEQRDIPLPESVASDNEALTASHAVTAAEEIQAREESDQEILDLLQMGLSLIPLLNQVNQGLGLDIDLQVDIIEKRLRQLKA